MPPKTQMQEALSQTLPANHRNATNAMLASLAELEAMLAPLFASPSALSETIARLDTEKRCQLELLLAYAVNTLAFINLKSNGTAPASHPVMHELKRIKAYTEKLRQATQGIPTNTMEVDKDAAARFIKGALAANLAADRKAAEAEAETEGDQQPQGTHTRFDEPASSSEGTGTASAKGPGLEAVIAPETTPSTSSAAVTAAAAAAGGSLLQKKRAMDPFHGYDGNKKSKAT
ncbi:hypothetical protein BGX29_001002 [Mortierella sp. GBA35]|nr:hypothetical protein BGX29_001002 [Mortierella sp. GBA35]